MRAIEARSQSYWNLLPKEIQDGIKKNVECGGTALFFYKETNPDVFLDVHLTKQYLTELGYGIMHEKLHEDGERLIIKW